MSTKKYTSRRNFSKTPEPKGDSKFKKSDKPLFVIQKHDAQNLHYDFRLEIDGVLKSWSIPKGPSTDPSEKRMAIPTDDHPIDYAFFEGTIPEDEYGGGTVMIWDRGPIKNLKRDESLKESFDNGALEVDLQGEKIQGGYAFVKMKSGNMEGNWLLMKKDDDEADARRNPVSAETDSIVSDRSLDEIEEDEED